MLRRSRNALMEQAAAARLRKECQTYRTCGDILLVLQGVVVKIVWDGCAFIDLGLLIYPVVLGTVMVVQSTKRLAAAK